MKDTEGMVARLNGLIFNLREMEKWQSWKIDKWLDAMFEYDYNKGIKSTGEILENRIKEIAIRFSEQKKPLIAEALKLKKELKEMNVTVDSFDLK